MKYNKEEYSTNQILEHQEHLSKEILNSLSDLSDKNFKYNYNSDLNSSNIRPHSSFLELMNWFEDNFKHALKDKENLNKYIHNRIVIDGLFLQFCKENNVKVTSLVKDSIISWNTDNNYEKFFVQGAFLIQYQSLEFIHCAGWHKGNQNEDEISFFVIVSNKNYEKYIDLRNNFDKWVQLRDRSNLYIRVIDGEDIPYTRDSNWDGVFLPQSMKNEIKNLVEGFLASKDFYKQHNMPWKRGILLYGSPGCGKTSIIKTIMSQYNFKPVTIVAGASDDAVREAFSYAEEQSPSLLYFEDLDSMLERTDISSFLNLMDGISAKNGLLVIATANEIKKLKSNITDRPSRFDRKFQIPLPDQKMTLEYIKKYFGKTINLQKAKSLATQCYNCGFSYAYLKDLYISAMFEALSHNKKVPAAKDIDAAFNRLRQEKMMLNGKSINTEKYFK